MSTTKATSALKKATRKSRPARRIIKDPPFPSTLGDERIRQAVIEFARENRSAKSKLAKRVVKFPPFPSTLGNERIRQAVLEVARERRSNTASVRKKRNWSRNL